MTAKNKHLSRKQINELQQLLLDEREKCMTQIHEANGHGTEAHGDAGDISSSLSDTELLWGLEEHEREYMLEIEDALKRIDNKTYGLCQDCGEPIPYERLKAIPTARYTVDCQEKLDNEKF